MCEYFVFLVHIFTYADYIGRFTNQKNTQYSGFFSSSVILDKKDNKQIKKFSAIWITNLLYLQPAIRLVFETHINGNLVMPLSNNSSIFRKSWTKYNLTPRHSSNVANLPSHITLLLAYYRILTHLALL